MEKYNHKEIEKKWQERWEESNAFAAEENSKKEKIYVLDMFPYPSGAGIHLGHVENYTATDIYSRFKRMHGYSVLHPMGWDAFGMPAENYAIKTGVPPQETTDAAIENFRKQIKSLGLSYDWSREVGTHNPDYYKWTQWLFLFLYKNGLAEKKLAKVNWCPKDQTVLANEQTVSENGEKGVCVRCGTKVVQKDLEQWFFKITDFADALVDGLDGVDWPESTKINQRNWIGRSEGAEIEFKIEGHQMSVKVFTTRPDTLFGATYLVLAPEHPLLQEVASNKLQVSNKEEVLKYINKAKDKTDLERQEGEKEKTGVELQGVKAINPANQEEIPVFVADYVFASYGTGAIMAVPAHDERDLEFAKKFNLPIRKINLEDPKEITERVGGTWVKNYRLRDWLISRQRYWGAPIPIVYDPEGKPHPVPEEHLPWLLPTDVEFKPTGISPLGQSKELFERTEKLFGKGWKPEADTMDTFVCSSWYFFRFADPHNGREFASTEAIQNWLPVDLYMGGAEHTVLHLMYARFITHALKKFGVISFGEPFLKLRHQGLVLAEDGNKMSKSLGNVVNPDDLVAKYGADALRLHMMFMGPLEAMKPWSTQNIVGVVRFLERVWRLNEMLGKSPRSGKTQLHQTIKKVGEDIENLKLNTAISALMILLNEFEKLDAVPQDAYKIFLQLLAPFAPHIAEELWERCGETGMIYHISWPKYDPAKIVSTTAHVAVQINGKVRAVIEMSSSATEAEALAIARADQAVTKWVSGEPKKVVYVPGRVLNILI